MEMTLSVELQDEPVLFVTYPDDVGRLLSDIFPVTHSPQYSQVDFAPIRTTSSPLYSLITFTLGYSNQLFLRDSFDINTTVTFRDEDKESLLFDAMDPGLLSGPASFFQDEL